MAKNDTILLDSIIDQRSAGNPTKQKGEVFEQFVLEQILKNFDLTSDEIDSGWTDGSNDGGIDGFYIFINGRLFVDAKDYHWPKSAAEIQVFLVTCKHRDTFQQAPLDSLLATAQELFDLSLAESQLSGEYSKKILEARGLFETAFLQLSLSRPSITFSLFYASRGETEILGKSIAARKDQLKALFSSYFSASTANFTMLGSTELVELYREVKSFALDLPVQECLTAGQEGYVVLAKLKDFCNFVGDDRKQLRRYLFDSNVRAYLGTNLVNRDIADTLENPEAPNFWWLNNGVTILATSASLVGKTLKLKDIQIVNGLQTTESIFKHYGRSAGSHVEPDTRTLLVKVIVSQDEGVRDEVIRATNNQSSVEPAALHATDRVQRDIEDILLRHEWFYERRTNYYKNDGRSDLRIVSPILMASGSVALLLKNPSRSSKLRQKHLRSEEAYQAVYAESHPINAWPVVAGLMRMAERTILTFHSQMRGARSQHVAAWRGVLAYMIAVRLLGTYSYQLNMFSRVNHSQITDELAVETWQAMVSVVSTEKSGKVAEQTVVDICRRLAGKFSIAGTPLEGKRQLPGFPISPSVSKPAAIYSEDFVSAVNSALPPQPWIPGMNLAVSSALGIKIQQVREVIKILIARGDRYRQVDGVCYGADGVEVLRDTVRAPLPD